MATLYLRKNRWWISYYVNGVRIPESTGYLAHEKDKALELKARVERDLKARARARLPGAPRDTFKGYRVHWVNERRAKGAASVDDDEARLKHARELDSMRMADIRPKHIRALMLRLRASGELAPRTVRHVYGVLRLLFKDACIEDVIPGSPCILSRGDLPGIVDKDPSWRSGAVFSRTEVERLLSDQVVPEERRTLYALLFCGGMRIGEVSALRWRDYLPDMEPLGKLVVAKSYARKRKQVKGTKSEKPREVPVHPALAAALASWRVGGWERYMGRAPREEDLLLPAYTGNNLRDPVVRGNLLRDLEKLGMRDRRTHDTRRTFISLALADGARKDLLRWVTHGGSGDVMDLYTSIPWPALCAEVGKLNIRTRSAATNSLHLLTGSEGKQ